MKKLLFLMLLLLAFLFIGCKDDLAIRNDEYSGQVDSIVVPDENEDTTVDDEVVDDIEKEDETEDQDDIESPIDPTACTMDKDCKDQASHAICVAQKCVAGCKNDDDCPPRIRCNTALGRCLNLAASGQACSARNCSTGCCYGEDGFTQLKCEKTPTPAICGICKQGEIFLDGNKCIPAACDSNNDNCPTLNAGKEDEECYACKAGALICEMDESLCDTSGSGGVTVKSYQCLSAGQQCKEGIDECCSGQPCVNGYCY